MMAILGGDDIFQEAGYLVAGCLSSVSNLSDFNIDLGRRLP